MDKQQEDSLSNISDYLSVEFGLDNTDIDMMLSEYFANTRRQLQEISHEIQQESWENLMELAHSMKGASGSIGAMETARYAFYLERNAVKKEKEKCLNYQDKLGEIISRLEEEFKGSK